jgi:citrate lyase subunit beta/citryl-CoA lyase
MQRPSRPRRSVLFAPASNARALSKLASLPCDAAIIDLEDSVAPAEKAAARDHLRSFFADRPSGGPEIIIRINALSTEWGSEDLRAPVVPTPFSCPRSTDRVTCWRRTTFWTNLRRTHPCGSGR